MYVFGMFYCGTLEVGQGPVLEINGGSGKPLWASWKDSNGITINKLSCSLLETNNAFLKVHTVQAKSLRTPLFSPVFKVPKFLQC